MSPCAGAGLPGLSWPSGDPQLCPESIVQEREGDMAGKDLVLHKPMPAHPPMGQMWMLWSGISQARALSCAWILLCPEF